ncbi:hypothetical protein Psuf_060030 [Phytohabitans suffuscus]|uniref:Uncharacterized protein n=1 Tax=Phytohabitans suffuscus TaxID=624315 RepID=A0A6F8YRB4_9ACTN|nr:hypothetical protein Psuf_060030 [Phytohabitans suffuscus]
MLDRDPPQYVLDRRLVRSDVQCLVEFPLDPPLSMVCRHVRLTGTVNELRTPRVPGRPAPPPVSPQTMCEAGGMANATITERR